MDDLKKENKALVHYEKYESKAKARNHTLISLSEPTRISQSNIVFKCNACGTTNETTCNSYNTAKNGCKQCKKDGTSKQWKGKRRKSDDDLKKTRAVHRRRCRGHDLYPFIKTHEDMKNYLVELNTPYEVYIISKMNRETLNNPTEQHHIIPLHAGGPNRRCNLITLTPQEHQTAHILRHKVYKSPSDALATRLRSNSDVTTLEAIQHRITLSHQVSKQNGTGFYSSAAQSENGKKGGKVQTEAKIEKYMEKLNPNVAAAFQKGTKWNHPCFQTPLVVQGGEVRIMRELQQKFVNALPAGPEKEKLASVSAANFGSNMRKVLLQHRHQLYHFKLIVD